MSDETTTETTDTETDADEDAQETSTPDEDAHDPDTPETEDQEAAEDTIVYKRADLEKLRQENGKYRQRAQRADQLAQRLHTELVRATGRLADPTDLPFSEEHLDDTDALATAIDDLLTRKPHLAARRPIGEIGQGATTSAGSVDLAAILRGKAG